MGISSSLCSCHRVYWDLKTVFEKIMLSMQFPNIL